MLGSPTKAVNEKTRLTTSSESSSSKEDGERSIRSSTDSFTLQEDMCGWGSWNPLLCQNLNNARWILFFFCTMACIQGMIMNGYTQTVVSTIEKRYNLRSLATGFILSTNDMAICLSLIPISYIGANKNKCTWIAAGAVLFSIGCLVFSSPHFLNGRYHLSQSQDDSVYDIHLCNNTLSQQVREDQFCEAFSSGQLVGDVTSWMFMAIFIIGRFVQGIGTTTLFLLAVVYIDENTMPATSSFYMGMFYGTSLLGPTIGYLLGAALLRLYVDFGSTNDPAELPIGSDNPLWVGAWWVGFLIGAVVALIVAIPISMYPKQLPSYAEVNSKKRSEVHQGADDNESDQPGFGSTFSDLPRATYSLLQNSVYTCIILNNGFDAMISVGLAAFFPKFLEAQLNLLPSTAAIAAAVIGIPSAGVGTILGGWLVKKFNMSCDQILIFCKWTTLLGILVLPAFLVPCDNVPYPGINTPYPVENSQENGLDGSCNSECSCIDEEYYPVCGSNDRQYFSPCHAGCKSEVLVNGEKIYINCGCITPLAVDQPRLTLDNSTEVDTTYAEVGTCQFVCKARYFLLIGMFAIIFISCLPFVPSKAVLLRVVPESQRSLAMGVRWIVSCLLGSIPGPILVGYLMDSTCVFWKRECDRSDHTCLLYDASNMRKFCFVLALLFKFCSLLFIFGASKLYKPPTRSHKDAKETTALK